LGGRQIHAAFSLCHTLDRAWHADDDKYISLAILLDGFDKVVHSTAGAASVLNVQFGIKGNEFAMVPAQVLINPFKLRLYHCYEGGTTIAVVSITN
jgi:hypothetical protein